MDKPNFLKLIAEMIPQELKDWSQWVCWNAERRNGKWTKVPYNANDGQKAKSNDSNTWASFELAHHQYLQNSYDGIGFMLSNDDPFTGFDFDHCRNPKTMTTAAALFMVVPVRIGLVRMIRLHQASLQWKQSDCNPTGLPLCVTFLT